MGEWQLQEKSITLKFSLFPWPLTITCVSFSPLLPPVMLGYAERQGLLENICHKTILKAETAQVRELLYTVFLSVCACTCLLVGLRIKVHLFII